MKNYSKKLRNLILDMGENKLGVNLENIKEIVKGIKYLPGELKSLSLGLNNNFLGFNTKNLEWLSEGIKEISNNFLEDFTLNL